jgi:hypothetical protein
VGGDFKGLTAATDNQVQCAWTLAGRIGCGKKTSAEKTKSEWRQNQSEGEAAMGPLDIDARRKGRKAMEKKLSKDKAALVRRAFKAGAPLKKDAFLHPKVALERAQERLADLRAQMKKAKLLPGDVDAALVYCFPECEGNETHSVAVDNPDALVQLSQQGALIVGILFKQFDAELKKEFIWPYFFLLGPAAQAVMLREGERRMAMAKQGDYRA